MDPRHLTAQQLEKMTDAEMEELLERAKASEEKVAPDKLPTDPEYLLEPARRCAEKPIKVK